jgi:redox-sensing transcriptional repressor
VTLHPQAAPFTPEQLARAGTRPDTEAGARLERALPDATVARLAVYLRVLGDLATTGSETVSSEDLAVAVGVNSAKLRKDLSYIGSNGTRGVGYEVSRLVRQIEHTLGLTHRHAVALVGVGNLGHALAATRASPPAASRSARCSTSTPTSSASTSPASWCSTPTGSPRSARCAVSPSG